MPVANEAAAAKIVKAAEKNGDNYVPQAVDSTHAMSLLEANNIITNPQAYHDDASFAVASGVRMGAQEMTRYGMQPADFEQLAGLIAEVARDGGRRDAGHWRDAVTRFREPFTTLGFTL